MNTRLKLILAATQIGHGFLIYQLDYLFTIIYYLYYYLFLLFIYYNPVGLLFVCAHKQVLHQ